jgi:hypothetical protein
VGSGEGVEWRAGRRPLLRSAMKLERLDFATVDWDELDSFADRVVFQTREWLEFVSRTHVPSPSSPPPWTAGRPSATSPERSSERYGLHRLRSPLPGWTTGSVGFNLDPGTSRREAVRALVDFSFKSLGSIHFKLKDRQLAMPDASSTGRPAA